MTRTFFIRIYSIVATNRIKERIIFYFFYFSYIKISKFSYFQKFTTIHSIVHKLSLTIPFEIPIELEQGSIILNTHMHS